MELKENHCFYLRRMYSILQSTSDALSVTHSCSLTIQLNTPTCNPIIHKRFLVTAEVATGSYNRKLISILHLYADYLVTIMDGTQINCAVQYQTVV